MDTQRTTQARCAETEVREHAVRVEFHIVQADARSNDGCEGPNRRDRIALLKCETKCGNEIITYMEAQGARSSWQAAAAEETTQRRER